MFATIANAEKSDVIKLYLHAPNVRSELQRSF